MADLRAATADAHRRLEEVTGLPETIRGHEDLAALLERLLGFHAAAEACGVDEALARQFGFAPETVLRSAWLAADLALLGRDRAAIAALPRYTSLGPFESGAARLGCAYVIEGSALGGRVIHAHLVRLGDALGTRASRRTMRAEPARLRLFAGNELRFFAGHGTDTARRWKAFGEAVERLPRTPATDTETLGAACATFEALIDWFGDAPFGAARTSPANARPAANGGMR